MIKISVSEFKSKALGIIDKIPKEQSEIIITKRGHPIAKVVPYNSTDHSKPNRLRQYSINETDIVSPLGEDDWDSCK